MYYYYFNNELSKGEFPRVYFLELRSRKIPIHGPDINVRFSAI